MYSLELVFLGPNVHVGEPCFLHALLPIVLNQGCAHHVSLWDSSIFPASGPAPGEFAQHSKTEGRVGQLVQTTQDFFYTEWIKSAGWFSSLYNLTLCGQSHLTFSLAFLLDIASSGLVKKSLPEWRRWQFKNRALSFSCFGIPAPHICLILQHSSPFPPYSNMCV